MEQIEPTTIFKLPPEVNDRWAAEQAGLAAPRPTEQIDTIETAEFGSQVGDRLLSYIQLLTGEYVRITQAELADRPEGFEEPRIHSSFGTIKELKARIENESETIATALKVLLADRQLRNEIQNLRCGGFFS